MTERYSGNLINDLITTVDVAQAKVAEATAHEPEKESTECFVANPLPNQA